MNQGAKVMLGLLAFGGIAALVFASGEKNANAQSGAPPEVNPPLPVPPQGLPNLPPGQGTVIVPPIPNIPVLPGTEDPHPDEPPPLVIPSGPITLPGGGTFNPGTGQATLPGAGTVQLPPLPSGTGTPPPGGTTITIPNPLTGQPLGTFNPATGNVFDATSGQVIGTFNPLTGVFTPTGGAPIQIPGFGSGGGLPSVPVTQMPPMVITDPGPTLPTAPAGDPANQPATASPDTIAVVKQLLSQEHSPHWRLMPDSTVLAWQKSRGLGADGKFGAGTAIRMAQEIGVLPIIRAWPKGTALESPNLKAYQAKLREIAATAEEPRRSQLLKAAQREAGQGYGTPEKPITQLISEDA